VHANYGIVPFAFDNIDVSAGTLAGTLVGRSSHWINGLVAVTRNDLISTPATSLVSMPAWRKPLVTAMSDMPSLDSPKFHLLPRAPVHTCTTEQDGPAFGLRDDGGLRISLMYKRTEEVNCDTTFWLQRPSHAHRRAPPPVWHPDRRLWRCLLLIRIL